MEAGMDVRGVGIHEYQHPQYGELIRSKVAEQLADGKNRVEKALAAIQQEYFTRKDYVVRPSGVDFAVDEKGIHLEVKHAAQAPKPEEAAEGIIDQVVAATMTQHTTATLTETVKRYELTRYATQQLLEQAGVPAKFAERLMELKDHEWLRANLNRLLPQVSPDGMMIRVIAEKTVKGVLSTSFGRYDASPIFEGFIGGCLRQGFRPYGGRNTESQVTLDFILPQLYVVGTFKGKDGKERPEVVMVGLRLRTSDYGRGAVVLALCLVRVWCANLAAGDSLLRKVHIGRRFEGEEGGVVELSERTKELDVSTVKSAINDVVGQFAKSADVVAERVRAAVNKEVNLDVAIAELKKKGFAKATLDKVRALYETEQPVESLPEQPSAWRLSNCLSLLAKSADGDEAVELERAAFALVA